MHSVETARLRLRPFTHDDLEVFYIGIMSDPEVMRFLPGGVPRDRSATLKSIDWCLANYREHDFGLWAVETLADSRFIGQAGLMYTPGIDPPTVEVAYGFAKAAWGQGFATEAAHASLRYGFEQLELDRIIAVFEAQNKASENVMIKLGMTSLGLIDAYNTQLPGYAITRAEFQPGDAPYTVIAV